MAGSGSTRHLLDLPADIHKLIVNELKTTDISWTPFYSVDGTIVEYSNFQNKLKIYYGDGAQDPNHVRSGQALLNLSVTCRYFRKFVAPELFETVVLRSRPKSMASIKVLSETTYWSDVKTLIFAGTFERGETIAAVADKTDDNNSQHDPEEAVRQRIEAEMVELTSILTNLPPNLTSLTLDFPNGWESEDSYEGLMEDETHDHDDLLKEAEEDDPYRILLNTVFAAVCKNDIPVDRNLELKLYNMPPYRCTFWDNPALALFLQKLASFTLSPCHHDNGVGWLMNTLILAARFSSRVGTWFFNHLDNVRTFRFHADETWPFGLAPGRFHMTLPLPASVRYMPKVEHVSFQQLFICEELVRFLTSHSQSIVSLDLTDCFAGARDGMSEVEDPPTWASFFTALTEAKWPKITRLGVTNPSTPSEDLLPKPDDAGSSAKDVKVGTEMMKQTESDEEGQHKEGANGRSIDNKRRILFDYRYLDDKYGMVFSEEEMNLERFLAGDDHDSYQKFMEIVERNRAIEESA